MQHLAKFPISLPDFLTGILNEKAYVSNTGAYDAQMPEEPNINRQETDLNKLYKNIVLQPGKVVSFSILNRKAYFKKTIGGLSGKVLMEKTIQLCRDSTLGSIETYQVPGNKSKVINILRLLPIKMLPSSFNSLSLVSLMSIF